MTTIDRFIANLVEAGLTLRLQDGELRYRAPAGFMNPARLQEIRARKPEIVAHLARNPPESQTPQLAPQARPDRPPLSYQQLRWWEFDRQPEYGPANKLIRFAIALNGRLDVEAIGRCVVELARRHESLRTQFDIAGDTPFQTVHSQADYSPQLVDLSDSSDDCATHRMEMFVSENAQCPFDLAREPLLRSFIFKLAAEHHVLLLAMHHIVADGWSLGVISRDLAALYKAFSQGGPAPQSDLPIQYADYAIWQRNWVAGEAGAARLAYWKRKLDSAPAKVDLAGKRTKPEAHGPAGHFPFAISETLHAKLRASSHGMDVTPFMAVVAALALTLTERSGQDDIVIGALDANRAEPQVNNSIGLFYDIHILRIDLSGRPAVAEVLARTKDSCLGALTQSLPYQRLKDERLITQMPNVVMNFGFSEMTRPRSADWEESGLAVREMSFAAHKSRLAWSDLYMDISHSGEKLSGYCAFNSDAFEPEEIGLLIERFRSSLESIVSAPV